MIETSIVLADDHTVVRRGLKALLEKEPGFAVVGEAGTGAEAIKLIERLRPEIAVVDLMMPGMNGLEVTREVAKRAPNTRVVILSMYCVEAYVDDALKGGALGYVAKDSSEDELIHAIKEAQAGRRYLSPALSMLFTESDYAGISSQRLDPYETLSAREREVLQLSAEGRSAHEIAAWLQVSRRTVESHRFSLMHKLGMRNQSDLIRYALKRGFICLD